MTPVRKPQGTVSARVPLRAGRARAGVDHAPGRAIPAGIPGGRAKHNFLEDLQDAGTGRRSFAAALSHSGRGRRHRFLGYFDPRRGHGPAARTAGYGAGAVESGSRSAAQCAGLRDFDPEQRNAIRRRRDSRALPRSWAGRAGDRLCRRSVDAGLLHDRRPRAATVSRRQDDAAHRAATVSRTCWNASRAPRRGI